MTHEPMTEPWAAGDLIVCDTGDVPWAVLTAVTDEWAETVYPSPGSQGVSWTTMTYDELTEWRKVDPPAISRVFADRTSGADLIAAERQRQIEAEGWTAEHDAEHTGGVLGMAASAYTWAAQLADAMDASDMTPADWEQWCPDYWPWQLSDWKPTNDPIRNLVKAGALIAAEIDRLTTERGTDA